MHSGRCVAARTAPPSMACPSWHTMDLTLGHPTTTGGGGCSSWGCSRPDQSTCCIAAVALAAGSCSSMRSTQQLATVAHGPELQQHPNADSVFAMQTIAEGNCADSQCCVVHVIILY
jgi:hypothetical protein